MTARQLLLVILIISVGWFAMRNLMITIWLLASTEHPILFPMKARWAKAWPYLTWAVVCVPLLAWMVGQIL